MSSIDSFKVGDWLIEPELLRISNQNEVRKLEFMMMKVLLYLVSNKGDVVSKEQLQDEVWGDVFVTENAITRSVSKLRKVLNDDSHNSTYIDTISKSGYRLIAPVEFNEGERAFENYSLQKPIQKHVPNWIILSVSVVFVCAVGLMMSSIWTSDTYSKFYDPTPVSTLLGPELGHALSPDGEKLSLTYADPSTKHVNVYVTLLDDLNQVKFTTLESPQGYGVWSPDGNYLAYVSAEDNVCGIYKESTFGGEKIKIGECYQQPQDFTWSPNGKYIAFTDIMPENSNRQIYILNLANQQVEPLVEYDSRWNDRDPVFEQSGERIYFRRTIKGQGQNIYMVNLIDKKIKRITFNKSRMLGLDLFDNDRQLAFSSDLGGTWALWRMPVEGGDPKRFFLNDRIPTEPKFSKNSKRLTYRSLRDQTRIYSIHRQNEEYNTPMSIASSSRSEIQASLSKDGQNVVYLSNRSGHFEIWMQNVDGSNVRKLTSLKGAYINMPVFSPDKSEILFDARIDSESNIYKLDIASKTIRTCVDLEYDQVNANFSHDGHSIYFASNHTGDWQIWRKSLIDERDNLVQITSNGGYYLQESLTNEFMYVTRSDTAGIWKIPKDLSSKEQLFIAELSDFDWGNWIVVTDGIIYVDRRSGTQITKLNFDEMTRHPIYTFSKRIQSWTSSLSANQDGSMITYVQIEQSEDEIMMVDFN